MRFRWLSGLAAMLLLAALPAAGQPRIQVLLLFDEDDDLPGLALTNRSLRETLTAEFGEDISFYSESLQLSQFSEPEYDAIQADYLHRKYQGKRLDLVVAVMEPSLDFLLRHRERLAGTAPIVFCGVDSYDIESKILPADVTGVLMKRQFGPTLATALELQPNLRQVYVVGGTSRFDRKLQDMARRDFAAFADRVSIHWLTDLSMQALLDQVATLPPDSALYYLTLFTDGQGQAFATHDSLRRLARAANAPVYVAVDQYVGTGAVGGQVYSIGSIGEEAGHMAARILRGEAPANIPQLALSPYAPMFDWYQLRRWNIDPRKLPPGSVVQGREFTLWESYGWYIVGGVSLFLLQSALVISLLVNRAQRHRAERARQESELHRRRAEEETQRQRDELAHALRLTTLGELTASIAHELNQPLTAIAANAQAARRLLESDRANPDIPEALEDLEDDSIRAAEIIQRLQALFRKKPGTQAPLDVGAVIDDVLNLLGSDMRNRRIQVKFTRTSSGPKVMGDGVQLRQVVINLIRNAEDAISQSRDELREIAIGLREAEPGFIDIEIRDSGTGVAEDELERIFEHFVSSKPQGLGMGLTISRSIVEAHGGKIWATRNAGPGITLHVRLPLARGGPA